MPNGDARKRRNVSNVSPHTLGHKWVPCAGVDIVSVAKLAVYRSAQDTQLLWPLGQGELMRTATRFSVAPCTKASRNLCHSSFEVAVELGLPQRVLLPLRCSCGLASRLPRRPAGRSSIVYAAGCTLCFIACQRTALFLAAGTAQSWAKMQSFCL